MTPDEDDWFGRTAPSKNQVGPGPNFALKRLPMRWWTVEWETSADGQQWHYAGCSTFQDISPVDAEPPLGVLFLQPRYLRGVLA